MLQGSVVVPVEEAVVEQQVAAAGEVAAAVASAV